MRKAHGVVEETPGFEARYEEGAVQRFLRQIHRSTGGIHRLYAAYGSELDSLTFASANVSSDLVVTSFCGAVATILGDEDTPAALAETLGTTLGAMKALAGSVSRRQAITIVANPSALAPDFSISLLSWRVWCDQLGDVLNEGT